MNGKNNSYNSIPKVENLQTEMVFYKRHPNSNTQKDLFNTQKDFMSAPKRYKG